MRRQGGGARYWITQRRPQQHTQQWKQRTHQHAHSMLAATFNANTLTATADSWGAELARKLCKLGLCCAPCHQGTQSRAMLHAPHATWHHMHMQCMCQRDRQLGQKDDVGTKRSGGTTRYATRTVAWHTMGLVENPQMESNAVHIHAPAAAATQSSARAAPTPASDCRQPATDGKHACFMPCDGDTSQNLRSSNQLAEAVCAWKQAGRR